MNLMPAIVRIVPVLMFSVMSPAALAQDRHPFRFGAFAGEVKELLDPAAIAVGDDDLIYVAEAAARVSVVRRNGEVVRRWGTFGEGDGNFISPRGIAIWSGEVFVSDAGLNRVSVFDLSGKFIRSWGSHGDGRDELSQPEGLAVNGQRVCVADAQNCRVQVFDRLGKVQFTMGSRGTGVGQLIEPTDVAQDDAGNIYVADTGNNRIAMFDARGQSMGAWSEWGPFPGLLDEPAGIDCVDNRLYVTDKRNHRVQVFQLDGTFVEEWGVHEAIPHEGNGKLHYPNHLAISPSNRWAAICESIENRLQVFEALPPGAQPEPRPMYNKAGQTHFGEHITIDGKLMAIAEPENHFIFVFEISRDIPIIINQFGERGDKFGLLLRAAGLHLDVSRRQILVSDVGTNRLQEFQIDYDPLQPLNMLPEMTRFARAWDLEQIRSTMPEPKLRWPIQAGAVKRGPDGLLYMVDSGNHCILVFDSELNFQRRWGDYGGGDGQFRRPTDLAFSARGDEVCVVDSLNRRVQVFSLDGTFRRVLGGPSDFVAPFGVAVGRNREIHVSDRGRSAIVTINQAGEAEPWGQFGAALGQLWKPTGIAVDERNRVIIIDQGNHRAQIFDASRQWLVSFGAGRAFTAQDRKQAD